MPGAIVGQVDALEEHVLDQRPVHDDPLLLAELLGLASADLAGGFTRSLTVSTNAFSYAARSASLKPARFAAFLALMSSLAPAPSAQCRTSFTATLFWPWKSAEFEMKDEARLAIGIGDGPAPRRDKGLPWWSNSTSARS